MSNRTIVNTVKQISRSGWIAWSSIAVMALAFFVGTVFAAIALVAHLKIQSIETRDNVLVFFEVGTDPALINNLREKWSDLPQIRAIEYTTEEAAFEIYFKETQITDPIQNQLLQQQEIKKLDSSLDIKLNSLEFLEEIKRILLADINTELTQLSFDERRPPIDLKVDDRSLEQQRDIFLVLRVSGLVLLALLFIIIFFFILMTVEYRTYNRMEEIGVMQLVGGSLSYIRAPFILEGAFYGAIGALVSALVLGAIVFTMLILNSQSAVAIYIFREANGLELPYISTLGWLITVVLQVGVGAILGAFISYLAIRRYIK